MRVERIGTGEPHVAVVGGIHGDEPCGVRVVEYLMAADLDLRGSVTLVIANEEAVDAGVRYLESDLNRAFPPSDVDPETFEFGDTHEGRLAEELYELLGDTLTLSLHSTQSHPEPFAVVVDPDQDVLDICARLPVRIVVDSIALADGRLLESVPTIEVECGYQGSDDATRNGIEITRAFLRATGVLPAPAEPREKSLYRLVRPIPKPPGTEYEVFVRNFELVEEGDAFAAVDGEPMRAATPFFPVLLSSYGYDEVFGYEAEHAGTIGRSDSG